MEKVDQFIEELLVEKGLTDLEPDVKEELVKEMRTRLLQQIDRAAIMRLSEEQAGELSRLMDEPGFTKEKMTEFMQNSGVNLTDVTLETMLTFRNFYLMEK